MYHIHYITIQAPRTTINSSFESVCNCLWKEWKNVVLWCHDDIVAQNYHSSAAKSVQSMYLCLTEGKEKYAATPEEAMCYMFTFRFRGTSYWRDATKEVPGPGCLINHSRCHANVSNLSTCLSRLVTECRTVSSRQCSLYALTYSITCTFYYYCSNHSLC